MIIDLPDVSGNTDNTIDSLASYGSNVALVNNNRSYVMKGASQDLIINGSGGSLSIGDDPIAFISYGGNIIIRSNIVYSGTKKPSIAFIALRNEETGTGGEIHIENDTAAGTDLSNIVGSLIAERGILARDESAASVDKVTLTSEERSTFDNQLLIEGSVMSKNTLGGGDAPYTCPSFIQKIDCTSDIAQKYDLNYIRRFVFIDDNADSIHDGPGSESSDNDESTNPLLIKYYINRERMPSELE